MLLCALNDPQNTNTIRSAKQANEWLEHNVLVQDLKAAVGSKHPSQKARVRDVHARAIMYERKNAIQLVNRS